MKSIELFKGINTNLSMVSFKANTTFVFSYDQVHDALLKAIKKYAKIIVIDDPKTGIIKSRGTHWRRSRVSLFAKISKTNSKKIKVELEYKSLGRLFITDPAKDTLNLMSQILNNPLGSNSNPPSKKPRPIIKEGNIFFGIISIILGIMGVIVGIIGLILSFLDSSYLFAILTSIIAIIGLILSILVKKRSNVLFVIGLIINIMVSLIAISLFFLN